jgi:hypothetical protein
MADTSEKRGRLLTVLGWYAIAVAMAGVFMTVLRDLPTEIAFGWTMWGLLVSVLVAATGVWLVIWGRCVRRRVTTDSN